MIRFASFSECWNCIQELAPGTVIEARTGDGESEGRFRLNYTTVEYAEIYSRGPFPKRILRDEFEATFQYCRHCKASEVKLGSEMLSDQSKYVLGIFHQLGK